MATPRVTVGDVGPRDGLQNEPDALQPATRAELVLGRQLPGRLYHAGPFPAA